MPLRTSACFQLISRTLLLAALGQAFALAQTIDDAIMLPSRTLFGGYLYTHDSWDQYWEGTLKRTNGNLGTVTTQTSSIYVDYGLSSRVNIMATIPYVWTEASQGVLASQSGWQDLTVAAKIRIVTAKIRHFGAAELFGGGFWVYPMTNYSPDFQPLSLGTDSLRRGLRSTFSLASNGGLCLIATGAYTWREDVTLDRPYYFTNNQLFLTSDVPMPSVVDYSLSGGYSKKGRMAMFRFDKLVTQGGIDSGDIRRQDLPFVANRIIASRIGATLLYPIPFVHHRLDVRFEYAHVIDGRNTGQSDTFTIGLMKTVSFK